MSALRSEQALATRARIAEAARELFKQGGWTGTRLRDVARQAGVAEPTVYAIYGSKAGLALALVDAVELDADVPQAGELLAKLPDDPRGQLTAMVRSDRRLFERGGDVIALLRDAGRSEPDLQAAYEQGRGHGDRLRREVLATWPDDALRAGITRHAAVDTFAALCNIDVYRLLTDERGWTPERIERWWGESLARLLLAPAHTGMPVDR